MGPTDDLYGDVGTLDQIALEQTRNTFPKIDGLAVGDETGIVPNLLDPGHLQVHFSDGIGDAEWARLEIRWYTKGPYNVHHVDSEDVNLRFDFHPKPDTPKMHVHSPPNAPKHDVEPSCISVEEPSQVARAVHCPVAARLRREGSRGPEHRDGPAMISWLGKDRGSQATPGPGYVWCAAASEMSQLFHRRARNVLRGSDGCDAYPVNRWYSRASRFISLRLRSRKEYTAPWGAPSSSISAASRTASTCRGPPMMPSVEP